MKRIFFCGRYIALTLLLFVLATFAPSLKAQTQPLITTPVDESKLITLAGSRPAALKGATDLGAADESQPSGRLMVTLKRSPEQETALQSFLLSAHQQSSPSYHKWLAPGEFGTRFGAADSDVQQVTAWMQSHGLTVAKVSAGKTSIEFSGTIGQVNQAFHTSIHKYSVNNETHYANATDPKVPAAFSAVVNGVTQLNDFKPTPLYVTKGQAQYNPKTHQGIPQWTYPNGAGSPPLYFLTPEDFSTQYDVKPLQAANVNGAGVTIGIINESNIDINLVNAYRTLFGLPANPPQIVIDGNDPGINGAAIEAYLDVENAGAIAPAATVKLYIADSYGLLGAGGLTFAQVRAVDDDAASILSLSFQTPEVGNPQATLQFFNDLWEQAAAQGQTVMVAAGDSGSASAEDLYGLGVNGFASTPWDVAVGGTDAYFGDFATGGSSIASYWSNANDANLGSLQKPMSEQPWNGSQYGLNSTTYDPVVDQPGTGGAGGGGASSCAMNSPGVPNLLEELLGEDPQVCISGYPKPSWQVGPGVPNDMVRDLPDVSLFASDGPNGVVWPICASAGDCTETNPANGQPLVTAVGGTSASAPAMAGVLALIEQKYGPQGQANYTLYPLARQFPTAFNDITVGSNNQPCEIAVQAFGLEATCSPDTNGDGFDSLQLYSATSGYDQASGLGTLDVNQLYTNWGKLTYAPSTTTLTLTPTTIAHGQSVLASVTVTGNGVPSGPVALVSSTTLPNNKGLGNLVLGSNGSVQQPITSLPGGTYTVTAQYNGDGINGPSQSQPVSVTVTPEASTLTLSANYINLNVTPEALGTITAGSSLVYGSDLVLDVVIAAASGSQGAATGTVTFSDGSTVLGTVAVNAGGAAEFKGSFLSIGSHTITASYSGDASYNASTTAPLQFTVTQVTTTIVIYPDGTTFGGNAYTTGQAAAFEALVQGNTAFTGALPTGTMTFQLGSAAPVTVPIITADNATTIAPTGGATEFYPTLVAGSYSLIVTYSGDTNYSPATVTYPIVVTPGTFLPSTTILTTNPANLSNIEPSTLVTMTMTVTGSGTAAPTGTVEMAFADHTGFGATTLVPGTGNTSSGTFTVKASALAPGNDVIGAIYFGDNNYAASTSAFTTLYDDPTDFSFSTLTPNVAIPSGSTGTAMISLGSVNGFNSTVALTCAAPSALICTFSNATVNLNGMTTANVTLNTVTPGTAAAAATAAAANHPAQPKPFGRIVGSVLACMLLIVLPRRRRFGQMIVSVLVMGVLLTAAGCHQALPPPATVITPTPPAAPPPVDAAKGTYNVVVTGTSPNGIVHNTTITVIVQ